MCVICWPASSQRSSVQLTPSSKSSSGPGKQPSWVSQTSAPSQNTPFEQSAWLGRCSMVSVNSLQVSNVQSMPSDNERGIPGWHPCCASHTSTPLQKRSSSHAALMGVCSMESVSSLHRSAVQSIPSSRAGARPIWHPVATLHRSSPLQKRPSSQAASLGVCSMVSKASLQVSTVQA